MWKEAGPPPDLATRLFTERIIYLVRVTPLEGYRSEIGDTCLQLRQSNGR